METEYDERTSDNTHLIALGCPMYERDLKISQQHAAAAVSGFASFFVASIS